MKNTPGFIGTPNKHVGLAAVRVAIGASGAVGTIEQAKANAFSVVRVSAGLYRFTLNTPAPPRELVIIPAVASQTSANSNRKAFYDNTTYTVVAGTGATFDIQVTDLTAASPVASDPYNGDSLHVLIMYPRYTN